MEYIASVFAIQNLKNFQIIIVDNASSKKEQRILKDSPFFSNNRVKFIFLDHNVGYFPAINLGFKAAKNKSSSVWVVGNNDVLFDSSFFDELTAISDRLDLYPVIAPSILTLDGVQQNPHVINKLSKLRECFYNLYYSNFYISRVLKLLYQNVGFFVRRNDEARCLEILEIEQGFGACYLITPLFFKYFDQLYSPSFLYHEEAFLQEQLNRVKMKTLFHPNLVVTHFCKAATGKLPTRQKWNIAAKSHWELRSLQREVSYIDNI